MFKHYYQDTVTNEIFPIETSFVINWQALRASPKYKLAMFDNLQHDRFKFIKTVEIPPNDFLQQLDAAKENLEKCDPSFEVIRLTSPNTEKGE